jgi:hypothetical protein
MVYLSPSPVVETIVTGVSAMKNALALAILVEVSDSIPSINSHVLIITLNLGRLISLVFVIVSQFIQCVLDES